MLSEPWRVCVELAWEAYRAGSLPIGAVVTDAEGSILAEGRNRIHEPSGPPGTVSGHKLAHAELNALLSLDHRENDPRSCVLWTTAEPCPLCAGALRMTDVGGLRFAAREPWAGSAAMFETVPYLGRGGVRVVGPEDRRFEDALTALQVERLLSLGPAKLGPLLRSYERTMPEATEVGRRLQRSGALLAMSRARSSVSEVLTRVGEELA